jgi:hypothetical protein
MPRTQVVGVNNPFPSVTNVTVPVGASRVPAVVVSEMMAVHVATSLIAIVAGMHVTIVLEFRSVTGTLLVPLELPLWLESPL